MPRVGAVLLLGGWVGWGGAVNITSQEFFIALYSRQWYKHICERAFAFFKKCIYLLLAVLH